MTAVLFQEIDGSVRLSSVSPSYQVKDGEVLEVFESVEKRKEYTDVVSNDPTKKWQLRDVEGVLTVYRVDKTQAELEELQSAVNEKRKAAIQKELMLPKFVSKQLKCFTEGLVFAEKYPELAQEREELLTEYNTL